METEGPISTDQDGNLDTPVVMCRYRGVGCKHLSVHDFHYFYCGAQPKQNQTYPWPNAGTHLFHGPYPNENCPFKDD